MARDGVGTMNLTTGNPVVTGTQVTASWVNTTLGDIAAEITRSLPRDGQAPPTANMPMGNFQHTGAAVATAAGQYTTFDQLADTTKTGTGAGQIGYAAANAYAAGTVGYTLNAIASSTAVAGGAGGVGYGYALAYAAGTLGRWVCDLALPAGASFIGSVQSGTGAVTRTLQARSRDNIAVEDFGAVGDGVTDDSAAFMLAFATATTGTKPGKVRTMPGKTYLVGDIAITAVLTNNNSRGEYPMVFDYRGSVLKIKAGATVGMRIGRVGTGTDWCNGIEVFCGTMDMTLMTNVDSSRGIEVTNSYCGVIHKHTVIGEGTAMWGLYFRDRAYTYDVYKLSCGRVKLLGANISTDAVTTVMFTQPDIMQINLEAASAITLIAPVVQNSSLSKIILKNTYNIQIFGGDFEGTSGAYLDLTGGGNSYIQSIGNNITSGLTYVTGTAVASRFDDKKRGTYGVTYGTPVQNIPTTAATTIWSFDGDSTAGGSPAGMSMVLVSGDDGVRGWTDLLIVAYISVFRAATNATYGTGQPTRTYTMSGIALQLALGTVAANNVRALIVSNPT